MLLCVVRECVVATVRLCVVCTNDESVDGLGVCGRRCGGGGGGGVGGGALELAAHLGDRLLDKERALVERLAQPLDRHVAHLDALERGVQLLCMRVCVCVCHGEREMGVKAVTNSTDAAQLALELLHGRSLGRVALPRGFRAHRRRPI